MNTYRLFVAEANEIIKQKFNNAVLTYPGATMNPKEASGLWTNVIEGSDFIAVGDTRDTRWFKDWDSAADYANSLTEKKYIGIREPECDIVRFTPLAKINTL